MLLPRTTGAGAIRAGEPAAANHGPAYTPRPPAAQTILLRIEGLIT